MEAPDVGVEGPRRLADRLAAARRGRFVGRLAELELFRTALLAAEASFAVLHIYGPGGVGKTALLREYARIATECGRPVVYVDGRNVEPSPSGFSVALHRAMGREENGLALASDELPAGVLLVDTYEALGPLDSWLRERFLPQLPARTLVVIAGRNPPAPTWRTDIDWAELTHIVTLRNLRPEEHQTYLTMRGIPNNQHAAVLAFTHGHPLALALVSDALTRGDHLGPFNPQDQPDVVRVLLERLVHDVPSADHRLALEVCVMAWATTEALLTSVLPEADTHSLFAWLRGLSFIEHGPSGLFPHDLAREALHADLRWRDADGYRSLIQRLSLALHARLVQDGGEQQRVWYDLLYLHRHDPLYHPYFEWGTMGSVYAEPATAQDHEAILAMIRRHQGDSSAQIARYWLWRQPEAFLVFREVPGEVFGFMAQLMLHDATPEDVAIDPAVAAALEFARRRGPVRPGEQIVHLRFWMSRDAYQGVSPAINLTAVHSSIFWTTHPRLAWNFMTTADPAFLEPRFSSIHMWRSPEADFEVDGRRYGVFAHDWRVEPLAPWLKVKVELTTRAGLNLQEHAMPPPLALSQVEFTDALRQALRDFTRPDRLLTNPLMRSRLVVDAATHEVSPATLQALLRDAAATLTANPKDMKLHRAIWHTYLEPAATQELAAEQLGLPFSTYRYHLSGGIERITEWLWQRELYGSTS